MSQSCPTNPQNLGPMNVFQFTIVFTAIAETIGQAGVELEALTAVQAAFFNTTELLCFLNLKTDQPVKAHDGEIYF